MPTSVSHNRPPTKFTPLPGCSPARLADECRRRTSVFCVHCIVWPWRLDRKTARRGAIHRPCGESSGAAKKILEQSISWTQHTLDLHPHIMHAQAPSTSLERTTTPPPSSRSTPSIQSRCHPSCRRSRDHHRQVESAWTWCRPSALRRNPSASSP